MIDLICYFRKVASRSQLGRYPSTLSARPLLASLGARQPPHWALGAWLPNLNPYPLTKLWGDQGHTRACPRTPSVIGWKTGKKEWNSAHLCLCESIIFPILRGIKEQLTLGVRKSYVMGSQGWAWEILARRGYNQGPKDKFHSDQHWLKVLGIHWEL